MSGTNLKYESNTFDEILSNVKQEMVSILQLVPGLYRIPRSPGLGGRIQTANISRWYNYVLETSNLQVVASSTNVCSFKCNVFCH
jgi:hypothetical protein